jgi:uncharacterized protein YndB with AHSA1/START domain
MQSAHESKSKTQAPALVMTRVFDAPRALVFEAWSKPEHFTQWFAPKGFTIPKFEIDFRAGGALRFVMHGHGMEHPFVGSYREIVALERIVFVGIIDEDNEVVTTVTFSDQLGGKTLLTVNQTYSHESSSTLGAKEGWTQTLDKLVAYVASMGAA